MAKVYTIKSKSEVYDCFVDYTNLVENLTRRCDNGKEYLNANINKFIKEKGIHLNPCPPHIHELNSTAERYNRSIMDTSRCLFAEAKVSKIYWPEIVQSAAYLKNRTLANTTELKTPYEIFFCEKLNVKYLKMYGSRIFLRIPEQLRKSKWDKKAILGVLLGYTKVGYRVLANNKVITARHVDIIEENVILIGFNENDNEDENTSENSENESFQSIEHDDIIIMIL